MLVKANVTMVLVLVSLEDNRMIVARLLLIFLLWGCAIAYKKKSQEFEIVWPWTRMDVYEDKYFFPLSNETEKLKVELSHKLIDVQGNFYLTLSRKLPEISKEEIFAAGLGFGLTTLPIVFPFFVTSPSDKKPHTEIVKMEIKSGDTVVLPSGDWYAAIDNIEIEEDSSPSKSVSELNPTIFWNRSFLATFGYEYEYDNYVFKEYNGECKHSSVPNIHWLGKLYNPRGLNQTVCGKLKIEKGKTVVLKIKSSPKEFHSVRTFLAWIPGAAVLAPILYGPWIESCDHTLEVQYE